MRTVSIWLLLVLTLLNCKKKEFELPPLEPEREIKVNAIVNGVKKSWSNKNCNFFISRNIETRSNKSINFGFEPENSEEPSIYFDLKLKYHATETIIIDNGAVAYATHGDRFRPFENNNYVNIQINNKHSSLESIYAESFPEFFIPQIPSWMHPDSIKLPKKPNSHFVITENKEVTVYERKYLEISFEFSCTVMNTTAYNIEDPNTLINIPSDTLHIENGTGIIAIPL